MFLKRIELQGFKSFADKSVITFDSDIIGIVGPNGCGKSNITDAIRWVLGEKSAKALRGKSMGDVIFAGSTARKSVNVAEVTLVFDNSSNIMKIDFDEVSITRRLHRDGESEYLINKTQSRLKDVLNLVTDTGLGKDSLSFISQGDVSSFADSKPEDRRLIFEEAAGVAKYKKRKNESLSKLERTQDNLSRIEDITLELENQVKPLKRQSDKALKYRETKSLLEHIEISVIIDDIDTINNNLEEIKNNTFNIESQIAISETTLQVNENKNIELKSSIRKYDEEINTLQHQYEKVLQQISSLEIRKTELDEKRKYALDYASNQQKIVELKELIKESEYEYNSRKKRYDDLKLDEKLLDEQLSQLDIDFANAHQEYEEAKVKLNTLNNRYEVINNILKAPFQNQRGVNAIMQATNTLSGIEGVVSELFNVNNGYEEAISSALGGALFNIITEDEVASKRAIKYLNRNKAGRATFLPINILKPRYVKNEHLFMCESSEGYLGVASDFVECDDKYNSIKESLLGNIIVCDDLDNATELAKLLKNNYQIVTLIGDAINRGGSMSGGKSKNATSPLAAQKQFEQVQLDIVKQKELVTKNSDIFEDLTYKKDKLQKENVDIRVALAQIEPLLAVKLDKYNKYKDQLTMLDPDAVAGDEVVTNELVIQLSKAFEDRDKISLKIATIRKDRIEASKDEDRRSANISNIRRELQTLKEQKNTYAIEEAKSETKLNNEIDRLSTTYEMTYEYAKDQVIDINIVEAREEVIKLRSELSALGNVNLEAPEQYIEVSERYETLVKQKEELEQAKISILKAIDDMDVVMIEQFQNTFNEVNAVLPEVFISLFGGGKAHLKMSDPTDVLNTGIEIIAQPPGKSLTNMTLLSGGEKTLIAISVLFSIIKVRQVPLCLFDEVEAALDPANVERVARYINKFKETSQFILVTHRSGTMARCDALYGITMQQDGVSQLLKVKLQDAIKFAEKEGDN